MLGNKNAFQVHTMEGIFYAFMQVVNFDKCNEISNSLYTDLQKRCMDEETGISVNELMVTLGMMVKRLAVTVDLAANHERPKGAPYEKAWENECIHEFVSMLIPNSGLSAGAVTWQGTPDGKPPDGCDITVEEVERAIREQHPDSDPVSRFKNDLHRPAKSVYDQRDRERDYVARKFEQSGKENRGGMGE